jgi:hypothetical protein
MRKRPTAVTLVAAAIVTLAAFAAAGPAAAKLRAGQAPGQCSPALDSQDWTKAGPRMDGPPWIISPSTYPADIRFCGPAHVLVHLHGASFQIRGGHCLRMPGEFLVRIGILKNEPGASIDFVGLFVHQRGAGHAGTFSLAETATALVYAKIDHRRHELAITAGTITVGRSARAGTFRFRLRDATRVSGSWSCD